jgi:prepilin-type N-terminal cleavage/methylation domain-containing protein
MNRKGFTLIELMIVALLISMIISVTVPRLLPMLATTTVEGECRTMMGFGRSVVAHALLANEEVVVKIDLDQKEYWAEALPSGSTVRTDTYEEDQEEEEEEKFGEFDIPEDPKELALEVHKVLEHRESEAEDLDPNFEHKFLDPKEFYSVKEEDQEAIMLKQKENMEDQFHERYRQSMIILSKKIVHNDPFDYENQSNLEDPYRLEYEEDVEIDEEGDPLGGEELMDTLVRRRAFDETIKIESIYIDNEEVIEGIAEFIVTARGLSSEVELTLANDDGDRYTVFWNPITGTIWFEQAAEFDEERDG